MDMRYTSFIYLGVTRRN